MRRLGVAVLALAPTLSAGPASALEFLESMTSCQAGAGTATFALDYSQFGVANVSSSAVSVECPLNLSDLNPRNNVVTLARTVVFDRSTTSDIACDLQFTDFSGRAVFTTSVHSTGGGPGSGPQELTYPFSVFPFAVAYWRVHCTIPPVESGAFSHVVSTALGTSE